MPTRAVCEQLLWQHESFKVNYYKFNQDMIQVPEHIFLNHPIGRNLRANVKKPNRKDTLPRKNKRGHPKLQASVTFNELNCAQPTNLKQTRSE